MRISILTNFVLAIELPSLRISPLFRIAAIVLLYTAALSFNVVYIQSIGLGIGVFSGLFHVTLISQSIEIFFKILDALILMPWSLTNSVNLFLEHFCSTEVHAGLLLSSLLPIKPKRLTKGQKEQFVLTQELKSILVGLCLGDLYCRKFKGSVNPSLAFEQGILHEEYLLHLYELFKDFCPSSPKIRNRLPHPKTGKVHGSIYFGSYSLPCFKELFHMFYPQGQKVVPQNIGDLLAPLSLAYWICDDGCFCKTRRVVYLSTNSFTWAEVNILSCVLTTKFGLNCTINKQRDGFKIRISAKSITVLQSLLKDIMPPMMRYKIGL